MSLRNHNWRNVVKALGHFGYVPVRQSGSHIILRNKKGMVASVPRYDPLPEGTWAILIETDQKIRFCEEIIELAGEWVELK